MSICSKSPERVAKAAHATGSRALSKFSHRFSPRKFTQAQLYTCLVLKMFFKTDYRGIESILRDSPNLCAAIGMKGVPHFTTLQKAEHRILRSSAARSLLKELIFFGAQKEGSVRQRRLNRF